jgi:hypothetical protein
MPMKPAHILALLFPTLSVLIAALSLAQAQEPPARARQPTTMPAQPPEVPMLLLTPIQQPMPPLPPLPPMGQPAPMPMLPPVGQPAPMPMLPATVEIICATSAGICSLQSAASVSPGTQCFCILPGGDSIGGVTQ